ncbi:hypothetical protein ACM64Y_13470 [Novispirillum sp. DQ9]|uniref:hypothetical protein n=1 Tax=Novispirillum sp. DQ9 TaxID=3398612 RepID=UPI003C7E3B80
MFLPDVLAGRTIAIAGPAGPLTDAVADAAGRAGAVVILCGHDTDSLDELAWELAERRDAPVEIVDWDGEDPGAGLRDALQAAGHGAAALVLLGADGWTAEAARAWNAAPGVVVVAQADADAPPLADATSVVLVAPATRPVADVAAWAVFLLTAAGRAAAGQRVALAAR